MSLRFKMILGIGTILLLVILVYAIIASSTQTTHLLNVARQEGELIASVADRALANAMEEGERQVVRAILQRIGEHGQVARIRIVDPRGAIRQSNQPEELGRALPPTEWPLEGTAPQPVWNFRERTVNVFRPILNGPSCVRCHAQDRATLGFLNVLVSFPMLESEMTQQRTYMILSGVAGLIAAGGLIWLFFTLVVDRRVGALAHIMGRVEEGDLSARAPVDDRDELGRLGKSFNAMVAHLAEARRQLEDRHAEEVRRAENLAALGKMAAGIAHEINNPIAGMQNCVRTLLRGPRDERQRMQYLSMLQEGLGRIGRIVGQLLNFAREAKPQPTRTHVETLLRRCLTLLEHELKARRVSCALNLGGRLPPLLADPHQLEQVFLNVLMNAVEAMPEGGTVTIGAGVQEREAGPFLAVRVSDTGVGIRPEHLPRIFDPFFTTKDVGKGTGLGLSVSYGIVRAHGGFIDVTSAVGSGTTVAVALPVNGA